MLKSKILSLGLATSITMLASGCAVAEFSTTMGVGMIQKLKNDSCMTLNRKDNVDALERYIIEKTPDNVLKTDREFITKSKNYLESAARIKMENDSSCRFVKFYDGHGRRETAITQQEWLKLVDDNIERLANQYNEQKIESAKKEQAIQQCMITNGFKEPKNGGTSKPMTSITLAFYGDKSSHWPLSAKYLLDKYYPQAWPLYVNDYRNLTNMEALVRMHYFYTRQRDYDEKLTRTFDWITPVETYKNIYAIMNETEVDQLISNSFRNMIEKERRRLANAEPDDGKLFTKKDVEYLRKSSETHWMRMAKNVAENVGKLGGTKRQYEFQKDICEIQQRIPMTSYKNSIKD